MHPLTVVNLDSQQKDKIRKGPSLCGSNAENQVSSVTDIQMESYAVSTDNGAQIELQTEERDKLSNLDVVWKNMYEGEDIDPQLVLEKEAEFYKGAPPQWLNFYCAERNHKPFVKRDIYRTITQLIQKKRKINSSMSRIDLFHQPGTGGTTLAMQVLWDLRKVLRCARVIDSISDSKAIAQQVITMFNGGASQNTVLLLVDNKETDTNEDMQFISYLQDNLTKKIKQSNINASIPVVIILNLIRRKYKIGKEKLMLYSSLSKEEQDNFKAKHTEIAERHDRLKEFHGFNIMQRNFNLAYITEACEYLKPLKRKRRPRNAQMLSVLALMNSYVPGSYLTETLCLEFLDKKNHISGRPTLEKQMGAFADLLVIYSTQSGGAKCKDRCIRMAHPMIADKCLQLLTDAGVTLHDTTDILISHLCPQTIPRYLVKTIKHLLTKREKYLSKDMSEKSHKFSNLIQDIKEKGKPSVCVELFKHAAKKFPQDPFIPQALSRFYYIELEDYIRAETWAKNAITTEPNNSFIRDTLGQVYKNQLMNKKLENLSRKILEIGKKAFKAFEDEAEIAEKEPEPNMQDAGVTYVSAVFNYRGLFGFIQVANTIFDRLKNVNPEWSKLVLSQESQSSRLIHSENCGKYQSLLTSLKQKIEDKCTFFDSFLMYSKPKFDKNEPLYIPRDIADCYKNYIGEEKQFSGSFAGLLSNLSNITSVPDLEQITEQWREIYMDSESNNDAQNFILSQKSPNSEILRPKLELQDKLQKHLEKQNKNRSPEFYLLVLLLFWHDSGKKTGNNPDLKECVQHMRESYERTYQKHLRSRYLVPLFVLGNAGGFHPSEQIKRRLTEEHESADIEGLQRIEGEIRNHKVFAFRGKNQIEVSPHNQASVYSADLVSFYVGFTIKGPVAYNIRYVKKSAQFVDKHKEKIIQCVEKVDPIIEDLRPLIGTEQYSSIIAASTNEEKMRKLYSFLSAGNEIKDKFYQSLLKNEQELVKCLEG